MRGVAIECLQKDWAYLKALSVSLWESGESTLPFREVSCDLLVWSSALPLPRESERGWIMTGAVGDLRWPLKVRAVLYLPDWLLCVFLVEELKEHLLGDSAIDRIFTLGNSEFPVSWDNEVKLWTFLEDRASLLLKTYKTTIEVISPMNEDPALMCF